CPLMAATTGTGRVKTRSITSEKRRMKRSSSARSRRLTSGRLSPAENAVPSPVSTTADARDHSIAASWAESWARHAAPLALALPARISTTAPSPASFVSMPPLHREAAVHVHRAPVEVLALETELHREPDVLRLADAAHRNRRDQRLARLCVHR